MKCSNSLNAKYFILKEEHRMFEAIKKQLDIFDNIRDIEYIRNKILYFINKFYSLTDKTSLRMNLIMSVLLKHIENNIWLDGYKNTMSAIEQKMLFFTRAIDKSVNLQNYILAHKNTISDDYHIEKLKIFLIDLSMHINREFYKLQSKDEGQNDLAPIALNLLQFKYTNIIKDQIVVVSHNILNLSRIIDIYFCNIVDQYLKKSEPLEDILTEMKHCMLFNLPDYIASRIDKTIFKIQKTIHQRDIFVKKIDDLYDILSKNLNSTFDIFISFTSATINFLKTENSLYDYDDKTENIVIFDILKQKLNNLEQSIKTNYNLYELKSVLADVSNLYKKINHTMISWKSLQIFDSQLELLQNYVKVVDQIDCYTNTLDILRESLIDNDIPMSNSSLAGDMNLDE